MKRFLPALLSCLVLVVVVSCSPVSDNFSNRHPQMVAAPDSVSAMLAEAADRASLSLEKLAAVEYSRSPGVNVGPAGNAPPELSRAVTVNWVGPVEPITQSMADRASYKFRTVGAAPPNALVVSIDIENRPVIEVLRDIGLQLGTRADIKVDSQNRVVELQYAPNTGVGE